ncbi:hypothetical protein [Bacillus cereus group sp. TH152-1LC]|uniref:hypothetical protein n=1 Tax=Bacillus cereus group sp. TH152-1LC TaxID=3018060 RepID=UPI0022E8DBC3|nr:hypothetical protein [Bacillus cereus group sp. TH152-1LC]MDA1680863.1 hypothetical protein [Bacillus cereus group sp. TH152-1LC]
MNEMSLYLSIAASVLTIISLIWNALNTKAIKANKIKGNRNIQSEGNRNINNTGDNANFK